MNRRRTLGVASPLVRRIAPLLAIAILAAAGPFAAPPRALAADKAPSKAVTFEEANRYFAAQEWAKSAEAFSALVKADPSNGRAWYRLGAAYANMKQYDQAIAAYRRGVAIGQNPFVMYNLACAYALSGGADSAFAWLDRAAAGGYRQPDAMDADADLAPLRSDPRYAALVEKVRRNATPCAFSAEARQFDFWVGTWDVRTLGGDLAGTNEIRLGAGQCVLIENWKSTMGGAGQSLNFYDADAKKWRQIWVDADGEVTRFEGDFTDGSMRFQGERVDKTGKHVPVKMTFTPLPDGRVRQRGEASADGGKTWTEEYDLYYAPAQREG